MKKIEGKFQQQNPQTGKLKSEKPTEVDNYIQSQSKDRFKKLKDTLTKKK